MGGISCGVEGSSTKEFVQKPGLMRTFRKAKGVSGLRVTIMSLHLRLMP